MVFFASCYLFGYLIQRYISGKKAYLLAPIGAFLATCLGVLVSLILAKALKLKYSGDFQGIPLVAQVFWQTFWGAFIVSGTTWFFRKRKARAEETKSDGQS